MVFEKHLPVVSVAAKWAEGDMVLAKQLLQKQLAEASAMGGRLAVLPEACFWADFDSGKSEGLDGPTVAYYADCVRTYQLELIAPLLLKEDGKIFNAMLYFDLSGQVKGIYRKVHPTPEELAKNIVPGPKDFQVFDTSFGKIGCAVCFDINYREVIERNVEQGAKMIVFPSMFQGLALMRSWARVYRVYFLSAVCVPYSALVNPLGRVLVAPWEHGEVCLNRIGLDFEVMPTNEINRFPELYKKYSDTIELEVNDLESAALFTNFNSKVSAVEILHQNGFETELEMLRKY